jgi:phosphate-selective porin OprO/OprP
MKSIQMRGVFAAVSGALLLSAAPMAMADSTDDIINALVGKGVLTEEEGALLMKGRTGEKEAAEEKKKSEVKASFKDGITWESGDKSTKMSVNGRIQLDSRTSDWSERSSGGDANANSADTFDIRRAYLGVKGTFWDYYSFEATADFAQNGADLDVAYLNVHWWKEAQFQFGQFKMPFSLEERTSSRFIDFQERSFVNNSNITPGKEQGMMVHGTPFKGVNYALALSTGQGKNTDETDVREDSKDWIAHADANFAEIADIKDAVIHVGASYANGDQPSTKSVSGQRTEGRGVEFFTSGSLTDDGRSVERTRQGVEGSFAYGPVKLQGEYGKVKYEGQTAGVNYDREIKAWYAEALWLITGESYADSYKGGKYDRIKPKNNFNPKGQGWGAWEVGIRFSDFDASDFKTVANGNPLNTGVLGTGRTNEADSWTVGLKWIANPNTRFLLNYVDTDFDSDVTIGNVTEDSEKSLTFRAQFDF